jgi:hypothetical protein
MLGRAVLTTAGGFPLNTLASAAENEPNGVPAAAPVWTPLARGDHPGLLGWTTELQVAAMKTYRIVSQPIVLGPSDTPVLTGWVKAGGDASIEVSLSLEDAHRERPFNQPSTRAPTEPGAWLFVSSGMQPLQQRYRVVLEIRTSKFAGPLSLSCSDLMVRGALPGDSLRGRKN